MGLQEDLATAKWIVQRVDADTSLTAYMDLIPTDVSLPAVRFSIQDTQDVRGVGDARERIMSRIDWLIVVIREGSLVAPLIPLANELDGALHNQNGATSEIVVLSCVRLQPFSLLEPEDSGVTYRHAGGIYRTMVQAP